MKKHIQICRWGKSAKHEPLNKHHQPCDASGFGKPRLRGCRWLYPLVTTNHFQRHRNSRFQLDRHMANRLTANFFGEWTTCSNHHPESSKFPMQIQAKYRTMVINQSVHC